MKPANVNEFDDDFFDDFLVCKKCEEIVNMDDLKEHIKKYHPDANIPDWQAILDFYNER